MTSRPKKALILLSSGLDSSVALSMAKESHDIALALTIDYGQKAVKKEVEQAKKIAQHYQVEHKILPLPWFKNFQTSALLNGKTLPNPTVGQLSEKQYSKESAKAVWVPNRNGVFIEVAASLAEEHGIAEIVVGFNKEEAQTFPDNSEEYLTAITTALSYSTANCVRVVSPTALLTKSQIVKHAKHHGFPFHLLWSCYKADDKMCGECESCMRLKRALHANAISFGAWFENQNLH
jgi:7-cyano-7-deazaguanine synthase